MTQFQGLRNVTLSCRCICGSLLVSAALAAMTGCATPPEIKDASQTQLKLLNTMKEAAGDLQRGLDNFHQARQQSIHDEGRVLLARQAINVAKETTNGVTADQLFELSNKAVRPWVDEGLRDLSAQIAKAQAQLDATTNGIERLRLKNELDDLRLRQDGPGKKPEAVKGLEATIQTDLDAEKAQRKKVGQVMQILQFQLGYMDTIAQTVDTWLATDVTLTDAQISSLKQAVLDADTALEKKP